VEPQPAIGTSMDTPVGTSSLPSPAHAARLVACAAYAGYDFGEGHPLNPRRLAVGLDLLRAAAVLTEADEVCPPPAGEEALQLVHTAAYVEALARLSQWAPLLEAPLEAEARRYGLGRGDNPVFPGAHTAAAAIAGGSLWAAGALLGAGAAAGVEGAGPAGPAGPPVAPVAHVFHPMGGLHHARPARAAGFCLYNDPALAIAAATRAGARVLYVDLDVHHGDGVQACFEDDPRVLTVSFHESGQYLFPGTGDVLDLGRGAGRGSAVNVPFAPGTEDASWVAALEALLPPLAERFRPDLLVSQHGCDTHALDPLADLRLTTAALEHQARLLHRLAHAHCAGRWLALGGGGYEVYRVVPRAWLLLWAEMAGRPAPETLPAAWLRRWAPESQQALPAGLRDTPLPPTPAGAAAAGRNAEVVARVRRLFLPAPQRVAHPLAGPLARPLPALRADAPSAAAPGIVRLLGAMPPPRQTALDTPRGPVLLRDWCPPSLVRRLRADAGLAAFTRDAERERDLLARAAAHPDTCLALAHTLDGRIVGQVTICAPEGRWAAVDEILELALETSRAWRRTGIAGGLLAFTLAAPWVEAVILLAEGYAWHWDTEGAGLDPFGYRRLLVRLLGAVGFVEERTDEPDIASSPANVLLVRVGRRVPPERVAAFRTHLISGRGVDTAARGPASPARLR
jgi:acetoin utilization deacetylase AcuC-like enzyme